MPTQPPFLIITSSRGAICGITTMSTKKKKSQKPKIPGTPSIKKAVAEAKCLHINDFIDDFANIVSSMFFQSIRDQMEYKDYTLVYYYRLSLILRGFNQVELDVLFSTSLSSFYSRYNKDGKKALRDAFKSAYQNVKCKLIENIIIKANLWLETLIRNIYHNKYHLTW